MKNSRLRRLLVSESRNAQSSGTRHRLLRDNVTEPLIGGHRINPSGEFQSDDGSNRKPIRPRPRCGFAVCNGELSVHHDLAFKGTRNLKTNCENPKHAI